MTSPENNRHKRRAFNYNNNNSNNNNYKPWSQANIQHFQNSYGQSMVQSNPTKGRRFEPIPPQPLSPLFPRQMMGNSRDFPPNNLIRPPQQQRARLQQRPSPQQRPIPQQQPLPQQRIFTRNATNQALPQSVIDELCGNNGEEKERENPPDKQPAPGDDATPWLNELTFHKVIIDTDGTADDAMGVLLALAAKDLEIIAITTTRGTVKTEVAADNMLKTLKVFHSKVC